MCAAEVFNKQDAAPPKPVFVSADMLGGHSIELLAMCVGADLQLQRGSLAFAGLGGGSGGNKTWCPKCPHPNGTCIADPYNNTSPPPSVYLDTNR